jgi:acetyl esterase/lipase
MSQRDRIDLECRGPLEQMLKALPGGLNSVADIVARRKAFRDMMAGMADGRPPNNRVVAEDQMVPGPEGAPEVHVRIYRPAAASGVLPGLFLIHGGGMILGDIEFEDDTAKMLCETIPAVVVSTGYRKAPENPHPAQVNDCYAALSWTARSSAQLGFTPGRLAIYGGSAGGNLVIATALMARRNKFPLLCFMMSIYPMLDDRNETQSSREITDLGIWDRAANIEAWGWFLGGKPADEYAAPARAEDLSGLPPAFIDVGEMDLFRDENVAFVAKLLGDGVTTEFHLYPGAYHASEMIAPKAQLSKLIWAARLAALKRALNP